MSLTQQQITLVQESWKKVVPISKIAAELFYSQLFIIAPEVKPLFKGDMETQGNKLMNMLNIAVNSLNDLDKIVPVVQESGRRHAGYGVEEEHYQKVAEALLWTLEKGLGDAFTEEVKHAWTAVYVLLSTVMKNAAIEASA